VNIYLDDEPVSVTSAETLTVQGVADQLRDRLASAGRMLTSMRCDGKAVGPDQLEAILSAPAKGYTNIEFLSSDSKQMVRSLLDAAANLFKEADEQRIKAADLLNAGQVGNAMTLLGACFQSWAQIHQAIVHSCQTLGISIERISSDQFDIAAWLVGLADRLRAIKEALEAGDHVSIADILRYEFEDVSEQWKQVIAMLREKAE